jgi:hypothetical protein
VLGSLLFYGGALTAAAGLFSLLWPLRRVGIRTRRRGALVAAAGGALAVLATQLPDPLRRTTARDTLIDRWMPEWQFYERHERLIRATPHQVFAALRRVCASDIFLFQTLTFMRNPSRRVEGEHILNAPAEKPIIDVALAGGFVLLGEEPDRELALGAVVVAPADVARAAAKGKVPSLDPALFATLGKPGFARAVMNFRIIPESDGWTRVTTETRVHAVDRETERRFALYWRVIYPGSWIIRWSWLRAIEARIAF